MIYRHIRIYVHMYLPRGAYIFLWTCLEVQTMNSCESLKLIVFVFVLLRSYVLKDLELGTYNFETSCHTCAQWCSQNRNVHISNKS